jgi:hypothetical protein
MNNLLAESWKWYPPVGVFIAILGLLGVIVPLFRDLGKMGKWEKAAWTLAMFALVGLEIRSIYLDRNAHDREQTEARSEQLRKFSEIAGGINTTIRNGQKQFETTMSRFDAIVSRMESISRKEQRTAELAKQNLDQVTGGDGFVYLLVAPRSPLNPPSDKWPLVMMNSANIPISDVSVFITEIPSPGDTPEQRFNKIAFGVQLPTISTVRPLRQGGEVLSYSLDAKSYQAILRTRNNQFSETIRIQPSSAAPDGFAITYDVYRIGDEQRKRLCCPPSLEFPSYYR